MNPKERLTLQIVSTRFPVPWGLIYLGKVDRTATLNWDNFLGMRCIIEQLPLMNSFVRFRDPQRPTLADAQHQHQPWHRREDEDRRDRSPVEVLAGQHGGAGSSLQFAERESRADFLEALTGGANDQLMSSIAMR